MPETRSAYPYYAHLQLTLSPLSTQVPSGEVNPRTGQEIMETFVDMPGLVVEVIPLMGEGENPIVCPAQKFSYPLRAFLENQLATLEKPAALIVALEKKQQDAIDDPTLPKLTTAEQASLARLKVTYEQAKPRIESLKKVIASTETVWLEDVLTTSGLPTDITKLFEGVFSEALDTLPEWKEENNNVGGIPINLNCVQWDIRFPLVGTKTINAKVGVDCGKAMPIAYTLAFESDEAVEARQAKIKDYEAAIVDRQDRLKNATPEEQKQLNDEIARYTAQMLDLKNVKSGRISALLSQPSVMSDMPKLLMGVTEKLQTVWPTLDAPTVKAKLANRLNAIFAKPPTPAE